MKLNMRPLTIPAKTLQQHEHSARQQQQQQHHINQYQSETNIASYPANIQATAATSLEAIQSPTSAAAGEVIQAPPPLAPSSIEPKVHCNSQWLENQAKSKDLLPRPNQQHPTNFALVVVEGKAATNSGAGSIGLGKVRPQTYQSQAKQDLIAFNQNSNNIQLVDFSSSASAAAAPAATGTAPLPTTTSKGAEQIFKRNPVQSYAKKQQQQQQQQQTSFQRNSISSQYSRSSSSSDEPSSSSLTYLSRANTFDDAAEHFIINYPSDSAATTTTTTTKKPFDHSHSFYYSQENFSANSLPLSETEPLLTDIESTVNDSKRSICLAKNNGSLVFTKKDLLAKLPAATPLTANNNSSNSKLPFEQHQQQQQSKRRVKHLPATYQQRSFYPQHQQHRRSLQLNYNNNLVTTTTCCNSNNNYCCSNNKSHQISGNKAEPREPKRRFGVSGPVIGTLTYSKTATATTTTTATAATSTTRKQHAYSWYAPVYSALEEELEHESRDSSPIHNLANSKQKSSQNQHFHHKSQQQQRQQNSEAIAGNDNESVALIESSNQVKIQAISSSSATTITTTPPTAAAALASGKNHREANSLQNRRKLSKQNSSAHSISGGIGGIGGVGGANNSLIFPTKGHYNGIHHQRNKNLSEIQGLSGSLEEGNGLQASSLGLAGGPLPTRKRFGNFLKSLVGLRSASTSSTISSSSSSNTSISNINVHLSSTNSGHNGGGGKNSPKENRSSDKRPQKPTSLAIQRPLSPEITITRTPSERNMGVLHDPRGAVYKDKLDKLGFLSPKDGSSTSSLNLVQQQLKNIMRREQSANSLHQEKSQSIVQYTAGMRKCETVLALTQPGATTPSSTFGEKRSSHTNIHTGSGIFSPNGVEQIRPLNRMRASATSIHMTCSRCSSLLSLAASGSRASLSSSMHGTSANISTSHLHLQYIQPKVGTVQLRDKSLYSLQCQQNGGSQRRLEQQQQQQQLEEEQNENETINMKVSMKTSTSVPFKSIPQLDCIQKKGSVEFQHQTSLPSTNPNIQRILYNNNYQFKTQSSCNLSSQSMPTTEMNSPTSPTMELIKSNSSLNLENTANSNANANSSSSIQKKDNGLNMSENGLCTFVTPSGGSQANSNDSLDTGNVPLISHFATNDSHNQNHHNQQLQQQQQQQQQRLDSSSATARPFESFTCKLCLIDVEDAAEATQLQQCGCRFCTECMKAYVEFEISEAAYDISCPDAQCPAQGVMSLQEITNLATNNLMKKHQRYRLNREIDMDKTRTWCPRAGCETVCHVGLGPHNDATPSTSSKTQTSSSGASSPSMVATAFTFAPSSAVGGPKEKIVTWAVQCPTCKDEFCSSCKKSWHPNISCEEHSRRLVADGQDDIGIPFDNDLIKCCPMCAVPIEKDEGCAQMMCKRCKHVFCWYCLASLDDDFLLRHYDKGPCKNKLGHSRASVVWHRAQVIGIFAGFGILLLVASPLLLLAAPCIICCKCRSCSGSKIDDGEDDLDEATALQSS